MRNVIIAALVTVAAPALAAPTFFTGHDLNPGPAESIATNPLADAARSAFFANLTAGTSTEGFESLAVGDLPPLALTFTGGLGTINATLTGTGNISGETRAAPSGSGQYAAAGERYFLITTSSFTVSFASPVAAFGFYGVDIETFSEATIGLVRGATTTTYVFSDLFTPSVPGPFEPSGSVLYLGIIDAAAPFDAVVFGNLSGGNDFFGFDELTVGDRENVVTPTPAAIALFGLGLAGLLAARRR